MKSTTMSVRICVVLSLALAAVLWTTPLFAQDAATTYKAKCAMCHGADGKADTPAGKKMGAHAFASPEVEKQPDSDLVQTITKGKNKMPAYESKLKPKDIKALVGYIRQLSKEK